MSTYKIALFADFLIATASTDALLRERAEHEMAGSGIDLIFDDLLIEDGLTLFATPEDAEAFEDAGGTIVWRGAAQGALQDDEGNTCYAAGRP